ncbi:MAG: ATP-binding cassette domain-containing protein, partial [Pseudomonadota bacterium]
MQHPVLRLVDLRRAFHQGEREIRVLDGASAELYPGQAVALVGPSGSGKSTLLHIAGLLESPDSGNVFVNGQDCAQMSDRERTRVRRAELGFVYQFHQLLPEFSALENVVIPQMIRGASRRAAGERGRE